MTEPTCVSAITPEGTGAIATVALAGPAAWPAACRHFTPAGGRPLPETPPPGSVWFGRLGAGAADEVMLVVPPSGSNPRVEVHCHGGRQVVDWLLELFRADGCVERPWQEVLPELTPAGGDSRAWALLPYARTARSAAVLLDQCHGAFQRCAREAAEALARGDHGAAEAALGALARYTPVGRHLVEPWRVALVGAPNSGKSSLLNALAGYQRSVVAPLPGTTRDVVTATLAFDGWPVEVSDTAGLRDTADTLEREGVERARATLAAADLCLWLLDTTSEPVGPTQRLVDPAGASREKILFVLTKIDLQPSWDLRELPQAGRVSAKSGQGLEELMGVIARRLVPDPPAPGAAVPFTPALCDRVESAYRLVRQRRLEAAAVAFAGA